MELQQSPAVREREPQAERETDGAAPTFVDPDFEQREALRVKQAREVGKTLTGSFFERCRAHPERVAIRRKELGLWEELRWKDYERAVRAVALGLIRLGVSSGDRVALISENRAEWLFTDLGILSAGGVTVALYTTSASDQVEYIVEHSGAKVFFVENEEQLDKALEIRKKVPLAKIIVYDDEGLRHFDDPDVVFFDAFLAENEALLAAEGERVEERLAAIQPEDLAILVYTSGTTGPPKGVMLSHANMAWCVTAVDDVMTPEPDDEYISFLPLCHVAERTITVFNQVMHGTTVNFAENLDTVRENLAEVRPHVFFAVPRIWEKLYNTIELRMRDATWGKRRAYAWAVGVGKRMLEHRHAAAARGEAGDGGAPGVLRAQHALADALVLRELRKLLGFDRTRFALSGAAPISPDVIRYFQALGIPLVEGYGQTESTAIITVVPAGFASPGTVGKVVGGLELRIADDGEILARGPGVMMGYFRQPEATAETISADGWLHTGDVGEVDERGFLRITDRKKDLIITAGGKNVAPQYVEAKLRLSPYIHDAVVIGERRKFIAALIILDEDNLVEWAQANRVQFGAYADLARSDDVKKLIADEVEATNKQLNSVEAVKKFRILEKRLDRDEGELTPTLKVRRKFIEQKYADVISEMYRG